jgi:hypothetical protein
MTATILSKLKERDHKNHTAMAAEDADMAKASNRSLGTAGFMAGADRDAVTKALVDHPKLFSTDLLKEMEKTYLMGYPAPDIVDCVLRYDVSDLGKESRYKAYQINMSVQRAYVGA